ncbi:MAG: class I SAM-dependent methyltransferase [Gammaproteobacteria bacterium]|nr:class I SAM-dependent methyltransferase [Gammaproteobacteria bacterium]
MLPAVNEWLATPLGRMLLAQERAIVAAALERAFGIYCVQLGDWGGAGEFLAAARTRRQALLASAPAPGAALVCELTSLPLQTDSVDVLLLPHTLEFVDDPHELLREAGRVLNGEGELIALAFEPLGGWSLRDALTRGGFPPGLRRLVSARRLTDWLRLVGFEVGRAERYQYAPPLAGLQAGRAGALFERLGRKAWPRLSGAYLLRARKRVYTMTPVRTRQRLRTAVIGGLVEPARRAS